MNELNSRLEKVDKIISELADTAEEIIQDVEIQEERHGKGGREVEPQKRE